MPVICEDLSKEYFSRQGEVLALEGVNLQIPEREFVSIVGPSGCGKTTLLKLIAGLIQPTGGTIKFDIANVDGHPNTSMVFQDQGLFPWKNVLDNVAFGLIMRGMSKETAHHKTAEFLKKIGLGDFLNYYPQELSGGMGQRVAIARAFLTDPNVLLMDEPFGALDAQTRQVLQEELVRIWQVNRKTVVFITHDIEEAILLSDRIFVMTGRPGKIREEILVPLERPRDFKASSHPEIQKIKWHIWEMLEDEVRKDLKL